MLQQMMWIVSKLFSLIGLGDAIDSVAFQTLSFITVVMSAFMIWKSISFVTNNESPIVVVLRGDILFLTNYTWQPIEVGEIVVFKIKGRDIPIVHRVLKVHRDAEGKVKILTKGDHNDMNDRGLYNRGQLWLDQDDIVGRVKAYVPYLGMATIIMNDYPQVKYLMISSLALFGLIIRE